MANKAISTTLIITVTLILVATVAVPVIGYAEKVSGAEYTYVNETGSAANPLGEYYGDTIIDIAATPGGAGKMTLTINEVAYNLGNDQNIVILASDYVYLNKAKGGTSINLIFNGVSHLMTSTDTARLEFVGGTVSGTLNDVSLGSPVPYTKLVTLNSDATWSTPRISLAQFTSINDVILSGYVTEDDNLVEFSVINGNVISPEGHVIEAAWELEEVSGTTDVYRFKSLSITVDDNEVSVTRILAATTVQGHEIADDLNPLYDALIILLIVGVLALAAGMVIRNKQ